MKIEAFPNFEKLWGVHLHTLYADTYTVEVTNSNYPY